MHVFIDPLSIYFHRVDKRLLFYYCLLLRELFLYSVVWWGIVPELTARALYITRQHYGKTVLEGEDNNIFSTQHPIPDIKEKHTQIQYNNNNKIYNVTLYLYRQTWPCWQQTTARVYFKGDKSWQKYIKITRENLCHRIWFFLCVLTPLSAIFQLYHGDQFQWWKKPEYPERTTNHGQATGKLYHLRLRVECTLFCNLQSRVRNHAVLVIGLYELLGNPTT
jgi:hypothetical protein